MAFLQYFKRRFHTSCEVIRDPLPGTFPAMKMMPPDEEERQRGRQERTYLFRWPATYYAEDGEAGVENPFWAILRPFRKQPLPGDYVVDVTLGWLFAVFIEFPIWVFHTFKHLINAVGTIVTIVLAPFVSLLSLIGMALLVSNPIGWGIWQIASYSGSTPLKNLGIVFLTGIFGPFILLPGAVAEVFYIVLSLLISVWLVVKSVLKFISSPVVAILAVFKGWISENAPLDAPLRPLGIVQQGEPEPDQALAMNMQNQEFLDAFALDRVAQLFAEGRGIEGMPHGAQHAAQDQKEDPLAELKARADELWTEGHRSFEARLVKVGVDTSAEKLPRGFVCSMSTCVMEYPFIASDGFSYEATYLYQRLTMGNPVSPMTGRPLEMRATYNLSLRQVIEDFVTGKENEKKVTPVQVEGMPDAISSEGVSTLQP